MPPTTLRKIHRCKTCKIRGGHQHETHPHYHLFIKTVSNGRVNEIYELFANDVTDNQGNLLEKAGTIQDVISQWKDRYGPFHGTVIWRGVEFPPETLLRDIEVNGEKLPLYHPNFKDYIMMNNTVVAAAQ